ncbi:MAG: hypothetical protein OER86_00105 [Phycisphaerae bacterium]|nr:hypothetical protein [Phycisphaerae bacterium]
MTTADLHPIASDTWPPQRRQNWQRRLRWGAGLSVLGLAVAALNGSVMIYSRDGVVRMMETLSRNWLFVVGGVIAVVGGLPLLWQLFIERGPEPRSRKDHVHWVGCILARGLVLLAATAVVACITRLWPFPAVDPAAPFVVAAAMVVLGPILVAIQLAIVYFTRRAGADHRRQSLYALVPILALALGVALTIAVISRPSARFEQMTGMPPPASASRIVYHRASAIGWGAESLQVDLSPADADRVIAAFESHRGGADEIAQVERRGDRLILTIEFD